MSEEVPLGKLLSFEDEFLRRQAKQEKQRNLQKQYKSKDPNVGTPDSELMVTVEHYRKTMKAVQDTFDALNREKAELIKKHNALAEAHEDLSKRLEMSLEVSRMMLLEMHQRHGITLERSGNLFLKHFHGVNTDAQTPTT
jgi:hypothetical protein